MSEDVHPLIPDFLQDIQENLEDVIQEKVPEVQEKLEEEIPEGIEQVQQDPFAIISPFFQIGGMIGFALFLFLLGKGLSSLRSFSNEEEES